MLNGIGISIPRMRGVRAQGAIPSPDTILEHEPRNENFTNVAHDHAHDEENREL